MIFMFILAYLFGLDAILLAPANILHFEQMEKTNKLYSDYSWLHEASL
jgi:hypothetical protein